MLLGLTTGRAGPDPFAGPGWPGDGVRGDARLAPGAAGRPVRRAARPPAPRRGVLRRCRGRGRGGRAHRPGRQEPGRALRAARVRGGRPAGPARRGGLLGVRRPVQPADAHRGHRHQRQVDHHVPAGIRAADGRPPDRAGRRGADPGGRPGPAEPAHHPRGHRPAGAAGRDGAARGDRGRHGGVQPRAGPGPGRRHQLRGGRVHQPVPGPPGLPRRHGRTTSRPRPACSPRATRGSGWSTSTTLGPQAGRRAADPADHVLRGRAGPRPTGGPPTCAAAPTGARSG